MNNSVPILYNSKKDCCGCGACINACPCQAISMQNDECGFIYPHIDESLCIKCNKCKKVCSFQNSYVDNIPLNVYAGIAYNDSLRKNSASGGVFSAIAKSLIEQGYVVYGAALQSDFSVNHIRIDTVNDLQLIQGSKYTQSNINNVYKEIRFLLSKGNKVLFSGTPCQVDGLYGFLGKDDKNLKTIDIICHGVPSNEMFKKYISTLGNNVTRFNFRDKSLGWGINGSAIINGKKRYIWESSSSYLYYFSKGWIYRENCYYCKYASKKRPADITLGDFWGIEKYHPDYLNNGEWNESKGISVVIINTAKGNEIISLTKDYLDLRSSTIDNAVKGNAQLSRPSKPGPRTELINIYSTEGWYGLEKRFKKNIGLHYYSSQVKSLIPNRIKRLLKSKK